MITEEIKTNLIKNYIATIEHCLSTDRRDQVQSAEFLRDELDTIILGSKHHKFFRFSKRHEIDGTKDYDDEGKEVFAYIGTYEHEGKHFISAELYLPMENARDQVLQYSFYIDNEGKICEGSMN